MAGRYLALRRIKETTVETKVVKAVKDRWQVHGIKLELRHDAGWPDRLFAIPGGKPFFVEFKAFGKTLQPLQEKRIADLKDWGYDVEVHDTYDGAMEAIRVRVEYTGDRNGVLPWMVEG